MSDEDTECIQVYYEIDSDETQDPLHLSTQDAKNCETDMDSTDNDPCSLLEDSPTEDQLQSWTEAPTKLLITLYKNLSPKVGETFKLKKKMWEAIKIEMDKHQYNFSVIQIENRWKTLDRAFKKYETAKKTGQGKVRCPYEKELAGLVKNVRVSPEFTLGANGKGNANSIMTLDSKSNLTENFPSFLLEDFDTENQPQSWTEASTKLLIRLYNNLSPKVGKTLKLKSKTKMWEIIKVEMDKHQYNFSVIQIKNKWQTLEKASKRKTGQGEEKANSSMILDSEMDVEQEPSQECKKESRFSTPSNHKRFKIDENQATTAPTTEQARGVATELKKMRMLKAANHNEMLSAYKQRTAEIRRRNDLLEKLISALEK